MEGFVYFNCEDKMTCVTCDEVIKEVMKVLMTLLWLKDFQQSK